MKLKIKKLNDNATTPFYSKPGDAGMDLVATSKDENAMFIEYGTGLAMELEDGYVGLIFPRSSISKYHLDMANSVGVIDSGYRGEVKVRFKKTSTNAYETVYNVGDKICQLIVMPFPKVEIEEVAELSNTERGAGGFGSSGA